MVYFPLDKDEGQLLGIKLLEVRGRLLSQVEGVTLVSIIEIEALLEHLLGGPTAGMVQLALHLLDELVLLLIYEPSTTLQ